ncbi:Bifunctional solanapyrone synthase [Lachnellula occidentalis]|uniref:Bifunctional solanapyrone synthase n=1 Tax=Lachnellula occidentalis TaxID=215460 RepID=A0A8H8UCW1_9HELO|nr:Bifunctional solanapyrone synthase [Lachnellula occidentalis]
MVATTLATTCCLALSSILPGLVSHPNSFIYNSSQQSYWALQEVNVSPSCIVSPKTAQHVSLAVKALSALGTCKFAVHSGGHTPFAGSANVASGVTIDLAKLDQITLCGNKTSVAVGPGQKWGSVYSKLQPLGLAVAGGRAASIGVGGLTLGGGTFYFASLQGLTCDNVLSFEVVLADGRIVTASASSNADLFVALKGGSNNFGIVTTFTFRTFVLGGIWAGDVIYPLSTAGDNIKAFAGFVTAPDFDEKASLMQTFGYAAGFSAIVNALVYAEPVVNPPALQIFTGVQPQLSSSMAVTTLNETAAALDASSPKGFYQILTSISIVTSIPTLQKVFDIWNASVPAVADIPGMVWSITTQPINNAVLAKTVAPGNSLGLPTTAPTGSFIIVELAATWSDAGDSVFVTAAANQLMANIKDAAKALGSFNRYIDLNHATTGQDPIAGYGSESKTKLLAASMKYDPKGVFQALVPGGFKLN